VGILAKLFGATSREELKGIVLGQDAAWEVSTARDFPSLLRALPLLLPNDAILYLEGGSPPQEIKAFLDTRCVPERLHLAMGTIWPRPETFHLPATTENLTELASLAEKCSAMQVAVHLHVYAQDRVLLEWYDAFWKDPFYLSGAVAEDRVRAFSSALGLSYKKAKQNVEPGAPPNGGPATPPANSGVTEGPPSVS
jgi:hypothetical protein